MGLAKRERISKKEKELLDNHPKVEIQVTSKKDCEKANKMKEEMLETLEAYQSHFKREFDLSEDLRFTLRDYKTTLSDARKKLHELGYELKWVKKEEK